MSWTDERIDTLKTMWEAGQTASQIAEALGGVSRNAVIGKAHRLGLQSRPSPVVSKEEARQQAAAAAQAAGAQDATAPNEVASAAPAEPEASVAPAEAAAIAPSPEPVSAADEPVAVERAPEPEPVLDTAAEEDNEDEDDAPVAAPVRERAV